MIRHNFVGYCLFRLGCKTPINPYAVAFILTEMRFRGMLFRLCEIFYATLVLMIARRDPKITVGYCQVSFSYWRHHFGSNSVSLILNTFNLRMNYDVCCAYLTANRQDTLEKMIIRYNGKPSALYVASYFENLNLVNRYLPNCGTKYRAGWIDRSV